MKALTAAQIEALLMLAQEVSDSMDASKLNANGMVEMHQGDAAAILEMLAACHQLGIDLDPAC